MFQLIHLLFTEASKDMKMWSENLATGLREGWIQTEMFDSCVHGRSGQRYSRECLQPSVRSWVEGCILTSGVGELVEIDGNINTGKCCQVLVYNAIASVKRLWQWFNFSAQQWCQRCCQCNKNLRQRAGPETTEQCGIIWRGRTRSPQFLF